MAIITSLTADRMLEIEAESIINGLVVGNNLILTKHDGSTINAGNVRGPQGLLGPQGIQGPQGPAGPSTGPAGGVLSGTYPNPGFATLEAEVVLALNSPWGLSTGSTAVYYRNPFKEVTVEGGIETFGGIVPISGSVIGTLQAGFRPSRLLKFNVSVLSGSLANTLSMARIDVDTNGNLIWIPYQSNNPLAIRFEGIHFRAA